jgi:pyrroline-5-carboxylate reductase
MDAHIVLVGCGKMGSALLTGWLKQGMMPYQISVVEPNEYASITKEYGVKAVAHYEDIKQDLPLHTVLFAVKPQTLEAVLPSYANQEKISWYISIAAGKTMEFYEKFLSNNAAIVRAMPNLPATIAKGISGLYANAKVSQQQRLMTEILFKAVGESIWVEKDAQMDVVTAISGSGPAYVFYFIECLRHSAETLGLSSDIAHQLALSTVYGSAALAQASEIDAADLRKAVTSPKGTTEAALEILKSSHGLEELLLKAVKAAQKRAQELAKN